MIRMQGVKKWSGILNGVSCTDVRFTLLCQLYIHVVWFVLIEQIPENSKLSPKKRHRVGGGGGEIRTIRGLGFWPCGVWKNTSAPRTKAPLFKCLPSCTSTKYILGAVFPLLRPLLEPITGWQTAQRPLGTGPWEALPWLPFHLPLQLRPVGWLPEPLWGEEASGVNSAASVWNPCTTWADSMNDLLFPLWTVWGALLGVNNGGDVKSPFSFWHNQFSRSWENYRTGNLGRVFLPRQL